jgi:cAMP phosphodiesterase
MFLIAEKSIEHFNSEKVENVHLKAILIIESKFVIVYSKVLWGHLAPSSHCSILIEISLGGKASQENDLSLALLII